MCWWIMRDIRGIDIERQMESPFVHRTNLSPNCGNCDSLIGWKEWGWCMQWEVFVHGHQDCPEWEIRSMITDNVEINLEELFDDYHKMLVIFNKLSNDTSDPKINERFKIMEMSTLKFLRSLRDRLGVSYDTGVED